MSRIARFFKRPSTDGQTPASVVAKQAKARSTWSTADVLDWCRKGSSDESLRAYLASFGDGTRFHETYRQALKELTVGALLRRIPELFTATSCGNDRTRFLSVASESAEQTRIDLPPDVYHPWFRSLLANLAAEVGSDRTQQFLKDFKTPLDAHIADRLGEELLEVDPRAIRELLRDFEHRDDEFGRTVHYSIGKPLVEALTNLAQSAASGCVGATGAQRILRDMDRLARIFAEHAPEQTYENVLIAFRQISRDVCRRHQPGEAFFPYFMDATLAKGEDEASFIRTLNRNAPICRAERRVIEKTAEFLEDRLNHVVFDETKDVRKLELCGAYSVGWSHHPELAWHGIYERSRLDSEIQKRVPSGICVDESGHWYVDPSNLKPGTGVHAAWERFHNSYREHVDAYVQHAMQNIRVAVVGRREGRDGYDGDTIPIVHSRFRPPPGPEGGTYKSSGLWRGLASEEKGEFRDALRTALRHELPHLQVGEFAETVILPEQVNGLFVGGGTQLSLALKGLDQPPH